MMTSVGLTVYVMKAPIDPSEGHRSTKVNAFSTVITSVKD